MDPKKKSLARKVSS